MAMAAIDFPITQGLRRDTFKPPAEQLRERTLAIPQLYEWTAINNPTHPFFVYHDGEKLVSINGPKAMQAIRAAAKLVTTNLQDLPGAATVRAPVIALLATTETITQFCFVVGVLYAGFTIFPISARNSPAAIAHLLSKSQAACLYINEEPAVQSLAESAVAECKYDNHSKPTIHRMPQHETLFNAMDDESQAIRFPDSYDLLAPAIIVHSSGSTSFPKIIVWTHRDLLEGALIPWFGEIDMAGVVMSFHSLPMFHGLGLLHVCFLPACGIILAVFPPKTPAMIPTIENVFEGMELAKCDIVCCVPTFIEQWSLDAKKVEYMKQMMGIIYGGGPLSKSVGDALVHQGVTIIPNYGSTEIGVVNTYLPRHTGLDWEYFTFSAQFRPEFIPYGDGTYELVLVAHDLHHPRVLNTKFGKNDAYATSDLLKPHPTKNGFWQVYGRADDQIMLANGEKTNPGPLERILCQDPHVRSALLFGRGRFQNGVIIDPKPDYAFEPTDESQLAMFRNLIWPTIERLNAFAPQHSRIFKEMIISVSPSKPFQYTPKGSPKRSAILRLYEQDIAKLYAAVEETAQRNIFAPTEWTSESILDFVRTVVNSVMTCSVEDNADIFQIGCDSLQATWIRNTITRAVRESNPDASRYLVNTLVYDHPTVASLARAIYQGAYAHTTGNADKIEEMHFLVDNYTRDFPARPDVLRKPKQRKDVVLVTGTTSGFGCDILAALLLDDTVDVIYAFNRNPRNVVDRQIGAFKARGLDDGLLLQPKFKHIEGDLTKADLGLDAAVLQEIRNTVTHIIHNAWRVDFNLSLPSFEANIKSLRNLIDVALTSPFVEAPQLLFVSSISVVRNTASDTFPEAFVEEASVALGTGYSESKWVGERMLQVAAQATSLRPTVLRLGQVCGDRVGYWNEREWFPALVKSAMFQRCLPDMEGTVSWIPSYEAAGVIVEMRKSKEAVLHVAHPHPVTWTSIMKPIAKELDVPLVPYKQWLSILRESLDDNTVSEVEQMRRNPALRLLNFFAGGGASKGKEPPGITRLALDCAGQVSSILDVKEIDEDQIRSWISAWRASEFLP